MRRVEQADWERPVYADWSRRLSEEVARARRPVLIVAHSLGTSLVTKWAGDTGGAGVAGAFLVATSDRERFEHEPDSPRGFSPMNLRPLPFPSMALLSSNDPRVTPERAKAFADAWGSRLVEVGPLGHISGESRLGLWPLGLVLFGEFAGSLQQG
jgi:predicted alpha/beta hydrolase family esterase